MNPLTRPVRMDALNEIETIQRCMSAVADLMSPEKDLHAVNRDDLAMLVRYFVDRLAKAAEGA